MTAETKPQTGADITTHGLLINGEDVPARSGRTVAVLSPSGEEVAQVAAAGVEDARAAVDAAAEAFKTWRETPPVERQKVMLRAAELLQERQGEFTELMAREVGGTPVWTAINIALSVQILQQAATLGSGPIGESYNTGGPGVASFTMREPAGVVLAISPWNAPIVLGIRAFAVAIALGNTVVLRPSEESPVTAGLALAKLMADAGLPAGVLNVITNDRADAPELIDSMISDDRVRRVNFTGSTAVGRKIGEVAGRNLTPVLLELGGKNPVLVLDDADLDYAVDAATFSGFYNSGQICMCSDVVLVPNSLVDEFSARLARRVGGLGVGDPTQPTTVVGPLITRASAERIRGLVDSALESGAVLAAGERTDVPADASDDDAVVVAPVVLRDVPVDSELRTEEFFGPLLEVRGYDTIDEAVAMMNDTGYGLSAGIITSNMGRGWEIAPRIQAGSVHVGDQTVADHAAVPFGGLGKSGFGKFGGFREEEFFTETRWITLQAAHAQYPL
ncbi:salicylaldehyde dehydrogenase [Enemella evansiae]|uniref:aldehyde dehydrogenase family protein n=1 Tax=Enemella evansiae TaxID=2016499 RepID=UPI000B9663B9|nr:aldehyde dehydrogenase family protein [Enemella evansiae]OYO09908.1 salicylaldehyde dehydrogenase [Enemella evansiae]